MRFLVAALLIYLAASGKWANYRDLAMGKSQ